MALDLNNTANILYTVFSIVIPAVTYLSNRRKATKKDVKQDVEDILRKMDKLRDIDIEQQKEINRLKKLKKIDAVRTHQLHQLIRKGGDKHE